MKHVELVNKIIELGLCDNLSLLWRLSKEKLEEIIEHNEKFPNDSFNVKPIITPAMCFEIKGEMYVKVGKHYAKIEKVGLFENVEPEEIEKVYNNKGHLIFVRESKKWHKFKSRFYQVQLV